MPVLTAEFASHVRGPDQKVWTFHPGDDVPEWAVHLIGENAFTPASAPEPAAGVEVPPASGPGSSGAVWATYAAAHGIVVQPAWSRAQIIEACRQAGIPVS